MQQSEPGKCFNYLCKPCAFCPKGDLFYFNLPIIWTWNLGLVGDSIFTISAREAWAQKLIV